MRAFQVAEEPGKIHFSREPDFKAILLIALIEFLLFFAYQIIPFRIRFAFLVAFTLFCAAILWPRIIGEDVTLTRRSFKYTRGIWPFLLSTELEWRYLDPPRILDAGVRGWRGALAFNDVRTGKQYRIGAGLQPACCRKLIEATEQFRTATS
jgi:hypothetical protein